MSTGTELPTYGTAFHADDTDEVVGYRTVSALAVVGMIIGLASPLCLAWPLLYWIPLLGAVICILAMRRIEASDGALTGRGMATLGLVLCVLCGTAAVSRNLVTRTIRTAQAEEFGRDWIELLLAGDHEKAFRLTVEGNRREVPPPEPGAPAPTKTPYEQFLENPVVTELAAAGAEAAIRPAETVAYESQPGHQFVIQKHFEVAPQDSAETHGLDRIDVLLTLQRSRLSKETNPRWLVAGYTGSPASADAADDH